MHGHGQVVPPDTPQAPTGPFIGQAGKSLGVEVIQCDGSSLGLPVADLSLTTPPTPLVNIGEVAAVHACASTTPLTESGTMGHI